jgi:hypothetical protein
MPGRGNRRGAQPDDSSAAHLARPDAERAAGSRVSRNLGAERAAAQPDDSSAAGRARLDAEPAAGSSGCGYVAARSRTCVSRSAFPDGSRKPESIP